MVFLRFSQFIPFYFNFTLFFKLFQGEFIYNISKIIQKGRYMTSKHKYILEKIESLLDNVGYGSIGSGLSLLTQNNQLRLMWILILIGLNLCLISLFIGYIRHILEEKNSKKKPRYRERLQNRSRRQVSLLFEENFKKKRV